MKGRLRDLDRRIQFQVRARVRNAETGGLSYTWANHGGKVWAQVQDVLPSRAERIDDGVALANRPARVRVRWRDDITGAMRIVYGARILRIVSGPAELGRRWRLELMCEEWSTQGDEP